MLLAGTHLNQRLQRRHIPPIIPRPVNRRLGDKCRVTYTGIIQQSSKRCPADRSLPDMLVPIEVGSAFRLGVIAMPDANIVKTNRRIEMTQRLLISLRSDDVISRDMRVAGINARPNG